MSKREELLAGVHRINRRKVDEREASQEAEKVSRTFVEGEPDKRKSTDARKSGEGFPSDQSAESSDKEGLEAILKAQVASRSETLREVELEIADCEYRQRQLMTIAAKLKYDVEVATDMLGKSYGKDDTGIRHAKGPVPKAGPGLKNGAKQKS
tara:strand:- start:382 stop:840 length:459 start_codon:yes stop_codon:yes gene_type:complete